MGQLIDTDALGSANGMSTLSNLPLDDETPIQTDDWVPTGLSDTDVLQRVNNTSMLPNEISTDRNLPQPDGWAQTGHPSANVLQSLNVPSTLPNLLSSDGNLIRPADRAQTAHSPITTVLGDANSNSRSLNPLANNQSLDETIVWAEMGLSANTDGLGGLETDLRRLNSCASSTITPREARSAFDTVLWHLMQREQLTTLDQLCLRHLHNRLSDHSMEAPSIASRPVHVCQQYEAQDNSTAKFRRIT